MCGTLCSREGDPTGERQIHGDPGREAFPADDSRKTHDCTVLADSSHGDSHVGSVSPAATRTRTLALTLTLTLTLTEVAVLLEAKGAYSGVSIRKLAQSRSPLRRSAEACVVPLSLGDNARNFDAFTQQGVIALGSELEISIEVRAS